MTAKALQDAAWAALPPDLEPYELEVRSAFLRARVEPGQVALDLGCGAGAFTAVLADAGAVAVGADIAEGALDRARRDHPGLDFRLSEPEGPLPLDDASADVCWASEVLAHVPDTAALLSEVRRILRPRGRLLVTTTHHGRLRRAALALGGFEQAFDPRGPHLRFYTPRSLRQVLEDLGFEVESMRTAAGPPLCRRLLLASARRTTTLAIGVS